MIFNPAVAFYAVTRGGRNLVENKKRKYHFDFDEEDEDEENEPVNAVSDLDNIFFDIEEF